MAPKRLDPAPDAASEQIRIASIVIIVTMVAWMGASFIGGLIGLEARYAFLFDLAALAAFLWALIVLFKAWRLRQTKKD